LPELQGLGLGLELGASPGLRDRAGVYAYICFTEFPGRASRSCGPGPRTIRCNNRLEPSWKSFVTYAFRPLGNRS
jgi:hypothetical protein